MPNNWSTEALQNAINNGLLNPKHYITRAEFAKIMDNLVKHYLKTEGTYTKL